MKMAMKPAGLRLQWTPPKVFAEHSTLVREKRVFVHRFRYLGFVNLLGSPCAHFLAD
jgi:hypothetical protein